LQGAEDPDLDADKDSRSYYFGPSTIIVSHIQEMSALNYFVEDDACAPGEETVPELGDDEPMVFEDFLLLGFGCLYTPPSQKFC
jgi:hypothetical protein